jgi:hypothetical protein
MIVYLQGPYAYKISDLEGSLLQKEKLRISLPASG